MDDSILNALNAARTKQDVKQLVLRHGYDKVAQQWQHLPVVQRGALALARNFDGVIIHEFNELGSGAADSF